MTDKYSYNSWLSCNTDTQKDLFLKSLVNDIAGIMDITVIEDAVFAELNVDIYGVYDYTIKTIKINRNFHTGDNMRAYKELMKTVVHECRHAYQYQYTLLHTNPLSKLILKEFIGNKDQFTENDAFAFEERVVELLLEK